MCRVHVYHMSVLWWACLGVVRVVYVMCTLLFAWTMWCELEVLCFLCSKCAVCTHVMYVCIHVCRACVLPAVHVVWWMLCAGHILHVLCVWHAADVRYMSVFVCGMWCTFVVVCVCVCVWEGSGIWDPFLMLPTCARCPLAYLCVSAALGIWWDHISADLSE